MRPITLTALAAATGAVVLSSALPADAQSRQRQNEDFFYYSAQERELRHRPRTRVTVQRRSYLDAGTEVTPGERKYSEYAMPYGYSAIDSILPPGQGWNRTPFNDPFDVPGTRWRGGISF